MTLVKRIEKLEDGVDSRTVPMRVHCHPPGEDPRQVCRACRSMTEAQYQRYVAGKDGWPPHIILDV